MDAVKRDFGSFDNMKTSLSASTTAVQGSGWGWLGYNKQKQRLEIATCPNQDPLEATTGQLKRVHYNNHGDKYIILYSYPRVWNFSWIQRHVFAVSLLKWHAGDISKWTVSKWVTHHIKQTYPEVLDENMHYLTHTNFQARDLRAFGYSSPNKI